MGRSVWLAIADRHNLPFGVLEVGAGIPAFPCGKAIFPPIGETTDRDQIGVLKYNEAHTGVLSS